jgi:hypothetical protein
MDRYPLLFLYRAWSYRLERRCFYPGFCILLPPVYWKTFFFLDTMHLYYPLVSLTLTAFVCWAGRFSSDV